MSENLIQKLANIRKMTEVLQRDKSGYGYTYVGIDSILARVTTGMKKYKVSLIPHIVPETLKVISHEYVKTKYDKNVKGMVDFKDMETVVYADMVFRWVNDEDPEDYIDVPWVLAGSQVDPSQAIGSALTYCSRYFLLQYFQIAQPNDDPDNYRSKQREAEEAENKAITEEILKEIDNKAKEFVANAGDPEDAKKELLELTSKYVKGGNYKKIDNPQLASKLLSELNSILEVRYTYTVTEEPAKKTKGSEE